MKSPGPAGSGLAPAIAAGLVAVGVRVLYLRALAGHPAFLEPVLDGAMHVEWARGVLAGTWPGDAPFFRAPGFVYFLAMMLAAFRDDPARVAQAQVLLGAVTPVLTALLAVRLGGPVAGWIAGLGSAVYLPLVFFDGQLLATFLAVPLTVLAAWLSAAALEERSAGRAKAAALLWGLTAIVRPTLLLAALVLPWRWRAGGGAGERRTASLLLTLILLLPLLVTVRNAMTGDVAFIATQGGLNFRLGNGTGADGMAATFAEAPGAVGYRMLDAAERIAEAEKGRQLRDSEVSAFWFRRTVSQIVDDPGRWFALLFKKTVVLLGDREIPNNHDFALFRQELSLPWLPGWGVWLPLAGAGAFVLRRRPAGRFVFLAALAIGVGAVLFFVNARFRLPAAPLLLALGAAGVVSVARTLRESPREAVAPMLIVASLAVVVWLNLYGVPSRPAPTAYVLLAEAERDRGEPVRSLRWIDRALDEEPGLYVAHLARLDLLRQMGRVAEASAAAERMLTLRPDDPALLQQSAVLLDLSGDPERGLTRIEAALSREPSLPGARLDRAVLLARTGRAADARAELESLVADGDARQRERARRLLAELEAGTLGAAR